jgi:hypothetical protein
VKFHGGKKNGGVQEALVKLYKQAFHSAKHEPNAEHGAVPARSRSYCVMLQTGFAHAWVGSMLAFLPPAVHTKPNAVIIIPMCQILQFRPSSMSKHLPVMLQNLHHGQHALGCAHSLQEKAATKGGLPHMLLTAKGTVFPGMC